MATTVGFGGLSTFNMQHGFVEALIRGFRSGFLQDETYHHITQCDNLEVDNRSGILRDTFNLKFIIYLGSQAQFAGD